MQVGRIKKAQSDTRFIIRWALNVTAAFLKFKEQQVIVLIECVLACGSKFKHIHNVLEFKCLLFTFPWTYTFTCGADVLWNLTSLLSIYSFLTITVEWLRQKPTVGRESVQLQTDSQCLQERVGGCYVGGRFSQTFSSLERVIKAFFFFFSHWWLQYCACVLTPLTSNWGSCHYVLLRSLPPPLLMWNAWPCSQHVQRNKRNKKIFADDSKWSEKISCLLKKKEKNSHHSQRSLKSPMTLERIGQILLSSWPSPSLLLCKIFFDSAPFFSHRCKKLKWTGGVVVNEIKMNADEHFSVRHRHFLHDQCFPMRQLRLTVNWRVYLCNLDGWETKQKQIRESISARCEKENLPSTDFPASI